MSVGKIQNFKELATTKAREDILTIAEAGLAAIDTDSVLRKSLQVVDGVLHVGQKKYDLHRYENIYVVGFGKVSCQAASTLEDIIGTHLRGGVVIGIREATCEVIQSYQGTHPKPSTQNFEISQKISELSGTATENDLVIVVVSGGGSALLCSSQEECDQGIRLYESFRKTGGDIHELNTVRKHLSKLKGGGLAEILHPSEVLGLVFSDVPGDDYSVVASGPTYKDDTTVEDAQKVLSKYKLGEFELNKTPKDDKYFEHVTNIPLVSNKTALDAMAIQAHTLGYEGNILSSNIYSPQEEAVKTLQKAIQLGSAVIAGGETSVTLPKGAHGKGGRNDLLALRMLSHMKKGQVFVSIASDGHDNSESAGALVEVSMLKLAEEKKIDLDTHIKNGDSFTALSTLNGLIYTGYLESNVSDLMILLQNKND